MDEKTTTAKIDDVVFWPTEKVGHSHDEIFDSIQKWRSCNAVITAGAGDDGVPAKNGIRKGHAYSVFAAIEADGTRMVRLQNPWGEKPKDCTKKNLDDAGLWSGRLCVGSREWSDSQYRQLRKEAERAIGDSKASAAELDVGQSQGFCWMPWKEFVNFFSQMTVCHRSHSIDDIHLDINEDDGCLGPTKGCMCGCLEYYCCCAGIESLCCETDHATDHKRSAETHATGQP